MDLKVLGLLDVQEGGKPIVPTSAPARQLLALLASHADHLMPTAVLKQELWPEGTPQHAQDVIETHVRHLRELIDAALGVRRGEVVGAPTASGRRTARDVLVSLSGGYRLDTGGGTSDLRMFRRTVGAGYRAMELEDYATAAERLGEALELWTADAYTGVVTGPHLRTHVARLEQSRLQALDQWVEAQRRLGRRHELYAGLSVFLSRFRSSPPRYAAMVADLVRGADHGGRGAVPPGGRGDPRRDRSALGSAPAPRTSPSARGRLAARFPSNQFRTDDGRNVHDWLEARAS